MVAACKRYYLYLRKAQVNIGCCYLSVVTIYKKSYQHTFLQSHYMLGPSRTFSALLRFVR